MNQKGNTLIEVIISFVIMVIITQMVITSFLRSEKVINENLKKENIIIEINNINNLFSADPIHFINNLSNKYDVINIDSLYYLYYDNLFNKHLDNSNNYIVIKYYNESNLYHLIINVYLSNNLDDKYCNLRRSITI